MGEWQPTSTCPSRNAEPRLTQEQEETPSNPALARTQAATALFTQVASNRIFYEVRFSRFESSSIHWEFIASCFHRRVAHRPAPARREGATRRLLR